MRAQFFTELKSKSKNFPHFARGPSQP